MEFDATYSLVAMTVTPNLNTIASYKDFKRGCHLNTISGVFIYAFMYVHILYCHIIYFLSIHSCIHIFISFMYFCHSFFSLHSIYFQVFHIVSLIHVCSVML